MRFPPALQALALAVAGFALYANTVEAPFLFDDRFAIEDNPTIRQLGWGMFSPPDDGSGATGRPVVNASFALNYAVGGLDPRGYHLFNILVHVAAGLVLLGIARRTLRRPGIPGGEGAAFVIALLWVVHPLQTETVACVVQRTEALMALFYLATLYGFIRAAEGGRRRWAAFTVATCALGMATKEVMVSAPLILLLYDRTFLAGDFRTAWARRRGIYAGLAATWILLAWLVVASGANRGGSAGFAAGISPWDYLLTQAEAIVLYLRLSVVPHPLVLDYGSPVAGGIGEVWLAGLLVLSLAGATVVALRKWPAAGFAGACFFAILAPSSSVVPLVTQTIAEHRMYLPLAAAIALAVVSVRRLAPRGGPAIAGVVALGFASLTVARNATYRDPIAIWNHTVVHAPENGRARSNLAQSLFAAGRFAEADEHAQASLLLARTPETHGLRALILERQGDPSGAIAELGRGLELSPSQPRLRSELGRLLVASGRLREGLVELQAAVALQPAAADLRLLFGEALYEARRTPEAAEQFAAAAALEPTLVGAHYNLAASLLELGRPAEARQSLERARQLDPASPEIRALLERVGR